MTMSKGRPPVDYGLSVDDIAYYAKVQITEGCSWREIANRIQTDLGILVSAVAIRNKAIQHKLITTKLKSDFIPYNKILEKKGKWPIKYIKIRKSHALYKLGLFLKNTQYVRYSLYCLWCNYPDLITEKHQSYLKQYKDKQTEYSNTDISNIVVKVW